MQRDAGVRWRQQCGAAVWSERGMEAVSIERDI